MQAYSPFNPVGAQHNYPSVFAAFRTIVKADGLKGLARGVDAAMLRTAMGSSVQLPAYNLAKSYLGQWGVTDGVGQFLMASFFSGLCVCAVMQPAGEFSTISSRGRELNLDLPQTPPSPACTTNHQTLSDPTASLEDFSVCGSRGEVDVTSADLLSPPSCRQESNRLPLQDLEDGGSARMVQGYHRSSCSYCSSHCELLSSPHLLSRLS